MLPQPLGFVAYAFKQIFSKFDVRFVTYQEMVNLPPESFLRVLDIDISWKMLIMNVENF